MRLQSLLNAEESANINSVKRRGDTYAFTLRVLSRRGGERRRRNGRDTRGSNEICISPWASTIRDWYQPGAMGTIPRKQVARAEVTCQKVPFFPLSLFALSSNGQVVIDRVVSPKDFSLPCGFSFPSYLSSAPLSFSLSKGGVVNSFGLHRVQWIEIKSSGGLATHNDIVDGPVGCHNIVPRLAAIP